jgi:hypothetical protein
MSDIDDELTAGYRRFRTEHWPAARAGYEALAELGQKPHTLIVACSDSRADPALIFDAKPGELFVEPIARGRNAAAPTKARQVWNDEMKARVEMGGHAGPGVAVGAKTVNEQEWIALPPFEVDDVVVVYRDCFGGEACGFALQIDQELAHGLREGEISADAAGD